MLLLCSEAEPEVVVGALDDVEGVAEGDDSSFFEAFAGEYQVVSTQAPLRVLHGGLVDAGSQSALRQLEAQRGAAVVGVGGGPLAQQVALLAVARGEAAWQDGQKDKVFQ